MNYEDTLLNGKEIHLLTESRYNIHSSPVDCRIVAKAQAQATWDIAIQEGRREVVEWVNSNGYIGTTNSDDTGDMLRAIPELEWQDQKKKWGL